jgi:hypothetical protein
VLQDTYYNSFNLYEKDCRSPSHLEGFEGLQFSSHREGFEVLQSENRGTMEHGNFHIILRHPLMHCWQALNLFMEMVNESR